VCCSATMHGTWELMQASSCGLVVGCAPPITYVTWSPTLPIKPKKSGTLSHAGLISAAPGRRNGQLQASAKQVEAMVRTKMEHKEYILLCLEDTNDWSNATTRRLVMQARPAGRSLFVDRDMLGTGLRQKITPARARWQPSASLAICLACSFLEAGLQQSWQGVRHDTQA